MNVYDRNQKSIQFYTDIVLVDVVGFSKLSSSQQVVAAVVINGELERTINLSSSLSARGLEEVVAGFVPTGDGFYVVLQPEMKGYGLSLAISLRAALLNASERMRNEGADALYDGVRIASHFGEVCQFYDITDKRNFVGHGMNECSRILGVKPTDAPEGFLKDENFIVSSNASLDVHATLYASDEAKNYFRSLGLDVTKTQVLTDKHGIKHSYSFVEFNRRLVFNPPKPSDYDERVQKRLEKYSEN